MYLLHFDQPLAHARHYVGYCDDDRYEAQEAVKTRLDYHLRGKGSRLLAAVVRAGIGVQIARVWPKASRSFERRLKGHSGTRYCPLCRGAQAYRSGLDS